MNSNIYDTVIIGGGPAGTGIILKTLKDGNPNNFLKKRIAIVEKSAYLIKGNITSYQVNSDTFSSVFLECLEGCTAQKIDISGLKNEVDTISTYKNRSIPLTELNNYYNKLGVLLKKYIEALDNFDLFMETTANKILRTGNSYQVFLSNNRQPIITDKIIIASGAYPKLFDVNNSLFSGKISLNKYAEKIIHSDTILKNGIPKFFENKLVSSPKVVVLGGSHSAFSVAHYFLHHKQNFKFGVSGISIWCNTKPKIYFPTKEDAIASGYTDFSGKDFCPITHKLFRLAGLRMDGRDLYMNMLGLNNNDKEERVNLKLFTDEEEIIIKDLEEATLVVMAVGYTFNMIPLFDEDGNQIKFKGKDTGHWVNNNCELLDNKNNAISNMYALGLATGFIPSGELGGEPTFEGQTNGIWYYQNALADLVIKNIGA